MTQSTPGSPSRGDQARERADLLESLARHRWFLRFTTQGLDDEQASRRTTVSALTLGGLIRHVSITETQWVNFIERGPDAFPAFDPDWAASDDVVAWDQGFQLAEGQTLADALADYEAVAARTEAVVRDLPDLDAEHPLPAAPWFEPGASWSARRVLLHLVAETSQHAGHADIIREALDGQKTMG